MMNRKFGLVVVVFGASAHSGQVAAARAPADTFGRNTRRDIGL